MPSCTATQSAALASNSRGKETQLTKPDTPINTKEFLLVSDFDQTLSFHDSGEVLSDMLKIPNFREKVAKLSETHLVQQGGELAYLLVHDPDFRKVRVEHMRAAGKKVFLKPNIKLLARLLENLDGSRFHYYVVSAGPQEIVESALDGIVPAANIFASKLAFNEKGEPTHVDCLRAGYGKVTTLDYLRGITPISRHHLVYVGDGSSDVHVMLHVNRLDGLTIAVSENKYLTQIAKRTVLSDDALSILIPILEDIFQWEASRIRGFLEQHGLILQDWEKVQTDMLTIASAPRRSQKI
jgi:2-hydroxy-3-keto-5-methylthiopentenyl-1-phosphate phosphatase